MAKRTVYVIRTSELRGYLGNTRRHRWNRGTYRPSGVPFNDAYIFSRKIDATDAVVLIGHPSWEIVPIRIEINEPDVE